jgi:hypothetical protein
MNHTSESSDSDSDKSTTYTQQKPAYIYQKMSPTTATIEHAITKHCLIITGRDLTPQTLLLAENVFNKFFIAKTIAGEDQVKMILGAFKDVHIRDWITTDCQCLLTLTFEKFIEELQINFLPSDWVKTICVSLLGMRMAHNTQFWEYAQEVHALNIVLHGTPSHLADMALRNQLEAGLESALQAECACEELYKITLLKEWIE